MNPKLELTDRPHDAARKIMLAGLAAHNRKSVAAPDARPLWVLLRDPITDEILGGLWGLTAWSQLHIETVFVPEGLRGTGVGKRILEMAEAEAVKRGCLGVWLDTYSFQSRGFYGRLGYTVFGTIDDYPPGHARYFMKKALKGQPAGA